MDDLRDMQEMHETRVSAWEETAPMTQEHVVLFYSLANFAS